MSQKNIRNFSIIAHIDHGKSTLADRMLEATQTIEKRKMKEQVLDKMDLERERGITIKMQPVRMEYNMSGNSFILNLIDTPGHIDFSYEVSRSLAAVEGVILLIDATQGVQAQTLTTLDMARKLELPIIPVLNKIDLPGARIEETMAEVIELLHCAKEDIVCVSAKTGKGVDELIATVIERVPPPKDEESDKLQALIFDFEYSNHQGVIVYARVFSGSVSSDNALTFLGVEKDFSASEVGVFSPERVKCEKLSAGEIGYIVTGVKEPHISQVGDTITHTRGKAAAIPGFCQPRPVVWASVYPESQDDFDLLAQSLSKLSLSDSSISYEEESSGSLGRGFRCGFLGMLHFEIIMERLRREFNLELVIASPTITYEVIHEGGKKEIIYSPPRFPDHGTYMKALEPWVIATIITPKEYIGGIMQLVYEHEGVAGDTETFGKDRISISIQMPLRELMRNFFDELKSISSGYASLSYEYDDMRDADVVRLDVLVAGEAVPALSRIVSERRMQKDADRIVEQLRNILPRQLFVIKIQAQARGRILSSRTLSALKKNVTAHLYGGDITRKKKLREKQKKGKKKMREQGKVRIPQSVFLKVVRGN
tara:strand:- start:2657 stop:4447 length:1791 start_codon:yes stop_codon:yes gene_type:complete